MAVGHVTTDRVWPLVAEYIEKNHYIYNSRNGMSGGVQRFAYATGLSARFVYDLRTGQKGAIDVGSLDQILSGLDLTYLANWPPEKGGFQDVFDNPVPLLKEKPRKKRNTECECGGKKHWRAARCQSCYDKKLKKKPVRKCLDCDAVLSDRKAKRCWTCWDTYRKSGKDEDARKSYQDRKDGISRVLKTQPYRRRRAKLDTAPEVR